MPIPEEILKADRPKNTVVIAYGKNKDHYAVRQRVGCQYKNGRHIPVNGPTIGHIVDGVYLPLTPDALQTAAGGSDLKDWADAGLKEAYEASFLSEMYKGAALSQDTVSQLWRALGRAGAEIRSFMRRRADGVSADHRLLVYSLSKSNESEADTLPDFSRKARRKGAGDVSLLYAYDLEAMEPVRAQCFPGSRLDPASYEAFLSEYGITRGVLVAGQGTTGSGGAVQKPQDPFGRGGFRVSLSLFRCRSLKPWKAYLVFGLPYERD